MMLDLCFGFFLETLAFWVPRESAWLCTFRKLTFLTILCLIIFSEGSKFNLFYLLMDIEIQEWRMKGPMMLAVSLLGRSLSLLSWG